MAGLVGFRLHRGVVAVADRPPDADADAVLAAAAGTPSVGDGPPLVVVLEGLNDPENIGAVFRNAAAFGAAAVLLDPTCGDPLYRRAVRVSAGHALHLPTARLDPWPDGIARLRAAGFAVCALAPHPEPTAAVAGPGPEHLTLRVPRRPPPARVAAAGRRGPGSVRRRPGRSRRRRDDPHGPGGRLAERGDGGGDRARAPVRPLSPPPLRRPDAGRLSLGRP